MLFALCYFLIILRGVNMRRVIIFFVVFVAMILVSGISRVQARGISGRVTDPSGNGIGNVYVSAYEYNNNYWIKGTHTDSDGNYGLNVPQGTYKVHFIPSAYSGYYAPEWYDNRDYPQVADLVTVTAFRTTANIDAQLKIGGTISGRATDVSGSGIADVSVDAYDLNDNWMVSSTTDSGGNYSLNIPAGTYKVHFSPSASIGYYAPEWYSNKSNFEIADSVTVTALQTTSSINGQLEIGGTISGRITDPSGIKGIANVYVSASDLIHNWMEGSSTDIIGRYSFNVPVGVYKVEFHPLLFIRGTGSRYYAPEWYNNRSHFQVADLVTVTAFQTTFKINGRFEIGGAISGCVTDTSGNAIAGVYVQVYDQNDKGIVFGTVTTDSKGFYSIILAPGNYKVGFFPGADDDGNYSPEWHNNKSNFQSADVVTIKKFTKFIMNVLLESK
jgi:hypothetical protein